MQCYKDNPTDNILIGLRWVFDALSNQDLDGIEPRWFCTLFNEHPDYIEELMSVSEQLHHVKQKLATKEHVIVGHNLFTDLMFFYNTFHETLPISVIDFQEAIHDLFPTVFDTKFLASYGLGSMKPNSNLKDLLAPFKTIHKPLILLHEEHTAYSSGDNKAHEAGFDSKLPTTHSHLHLY